MWYGSSDSDRYPHLFLCLSTWIKVIWVSGCGVRNRNREHGWPYSTSSWRCSGNGVSPWETTQHTSRPQDGNILLARTWCGVRVRSARILIISRIFTKNLTRASNTGTKRSGELVEKIADFGMARILKQRKEEFEDMPSTPQLHSTNCPRTNLNSVERTHRHG